VIGSSIERGLATVAHIRNAARAPSRARQAGVSCAPKTPWETTQKNDLTPTNNRAINFRNYLLGRGEIKTQLNWWVCFSRILSVIFRPLRPTDVWNLIHFGAPAYVCSKQAKQALFGYKFKPRFWVKPHRIRGRYMKSLTQECGFKLNPVFPRYM